MSGNCVIPKLDGFEIFKSDWLQKALLLPVLVLYSIYTQFPV